MKTTNSQSLRVLAVAPSSHGFGFSVMEGNSTLVDWGFKSMKSDKNARALSSVANLVTQYNPKVVVLQDVRSKGSRRSSRVRSLLEEIAALAVGANITVKRFSRKQLSRGFFSDGERTKHDLAACVATRFPEELGFRLPAKRRLWTSEDYRLDIFDAVALAEHCLRNTKHASREDQLAKEK
jgi:hypothetical protein